MVRQAASSSGNDGTTNSRLTVEPGSGGGQRLGNTNNSSAPPPSRSLTSRLPDSFDVFGFTISPGQFLLVQLVATFMLGFHGTLAFLGCLMAYHLFQRFTGGSGSGGSSSSSGTNRRLGGGANIKGVSDLPPDPRGG